jgi:hypothetical protein
MYNNKRIVFFLSVKQCYCSTATGRRSAPLNLTGLPGTEKLNDREKEVHTESIPLHMNSRISMDVRLSAPPEQEMEG